MNIEKRKRVDEQEDQKESLKKPCLSLDPEELICPITREIFCIPVTAEDGFTYERWALDKHLEENENSPMTRDPISSDYYENQFMKCIISKLLESNPDLKDEQFQESVYNNFLENKKTFIKYLKRNDFEKFSRASDIQLNYKSCLNNDVRHRNYETSVIQYISCKFNGSVETFEKILKNSFDLNCEDSKCNKPMYYIAKNCEFEHIQTAIKLGADILNISNNLTKNFISAIISNAKLSHENQDTLMEYLFENDYITKAFIRAPECITVFDTFYPEYKTYYKRILNTVVNNEEALYRLVDITVLSKCISKEMNYYKINKLLKIIEEQEYSTTKSFEYYKKKYDLYGRQITYLKQLMLDLYQSIDNNSELTIEERKEVAKRLKNFYENKINIEAIDRSLFNENIVRLEKILGQYNEETNNFYNVNFCE